MAVARQRRLRRLGLFFAGSLGLHACLLYSAATDRVRPFSVTHDEPQAIPVAFAPRPPSAKHHQPPPRKRPRAARRPSAAITAPSEVKVAEIASVPLAESLGPTAPFAPSGLPGAGDIAPGVSDAPTGLADAAGSDHYPINPGYWEVVEHWPLINRRERYCLEPQNIIRFMAAPCNHIYHCSYPVQVFEGDKFHFQGVITGNHERFDVKGGGDYTPTSLRVSVRMQGHYKIAPVLFLASLDGQFLGAECPADAKRVRQR